MQNILCLYKPVGETPLQTILRYKKRQGVLAKQTLSFAGRLDPMAEGLLLVLVGDENKKRKEYEALEKEYEFSVLFGLKTDSYDLLGFPVIKQETPLTNEATEKLGLFQKTELGEHIQDYPPFSSKAVRGKPLYYWAREGKLSEIIIPSKKINISSLTLKKKSQISATIVLEKVTGILPTLKGEFRQDAIVKAWMNVLNKKSNTTFSLFSFSVTCSSGTYVRSIAHAMGEYLGSGAVAYSIRRIRVGSFTLDDAISLY